MAAYWDAEKGEVIPCDSVDISIAVATEKVMLIFLVKLVHTISNHTVIIITF